MYTTEEIKALAEKEFPFHSPDRFEPVSLRAIHRREGFELGMLKYQTLQPGWVKAKDGTPEPFAGTKISSIVAVLFKSMIPSLAFYSYKENKWVFEFKSENPPEVIYWMYLNPPKDENN